MGNLRFAASPKSWQFLPEILTIEKYYCFSPTQTILSLSDTYKKTPLSPNALCTGKTKPYTRKHTKTVLKTHTHKHNAKEWFIIITWPRRPGPNPGLLQANSTCRPSFPN